LALNDLLKPILNPLQKLQNKNHMIYKKLNIFSGQSKEMFKISFRFLEASI